MKPMDDIAKETMQEMKLTDRRSVTSPENGKKGGRPENDYIQLVETFLNEKFSKQDGTYKLCCSAGRFYVYDEKCWKQKLQTDLRPRIISFLQDHDIRVGRKTTETFLENLQSERFIALDSDTFKIPCFLPSGTNAIGWMPMLNKIVNVKTLAMALGEGKAIPDDAIKDTTPALFCTYRLPYSFDQNADCPKFKKYLSEVQPEEENRRLLQMLAGLLLIPCCDCNVCFILYGESGTGKSQFLDILDAMLGGEANVCSVPLENFADPYSLKDLTEKLANIVPEMPDEYFTLKQSQCNLKKTTGGEPLYINVKYEQPYNAKATARLVFGTNVFPAFPDKSDAVWNRVRIIPFNVIFRGTKTEIKAIGKQIAAEEISGIFNWALLGLYELMKLDYKFPECEEGRMMKNEERLKADHEREFILEHTEAAVGSWCSSDTLYQQYKSDAIESGNHACNRGNFCDALKRIYKKMGVIVFEDNVRIDGIRKRRYRNIRCKNDF